MRSKANLLPATSSPGPARALFVLAGLAILGLASFLATRAPEAGAQSAGECSNAEFRQGIASHLPDCRAYEQVSPVEKNGADIGSFLNDGSGTAEAGGPTSPSGDAVAYQAFGAFAGSDWGGNAVLGYLSRRTSAGWTTAPLQPEPEDPASTYRVAGFTDDLEGSLLTSSSSLTSEVTSDNTAYYRDTRTGAIELLLDVPARDLTNPSLSMDLSHIVFTSLDVLTDEPGQPTGRFDRKVYEYTGGELRLVTRMPGSNEPSQDGSFLGCSNSAFCDQPVSPDGRHIFFVTPQSSNASKIYRRTDGQATELASPNRRTPSDTESEKDFIRSVDNGNRVLFTSTQRLTDDANVSTGLGEGDLYLYDFDQDRLVNLSQGTPGEDDAGVLGVVSGSTDGEKVYFVAIGELVPGEGTPGAPKLFAWEDDLAIGDVRFIADLEPSDEPIWGWGPDKGAQASSDGSRLAFESSGGLNGANPTGERQVFLYDADAEAQAEYPVCLSCPPGGSASGPATLVKWQQDVLLGMEHPPTLSSDGSHVVFSSPDPLVPGDSNGRFDAYIWSEGELSLLSSGRGSDDSYAHAISASGNDAFFRTREQLVPSDGDSLIDLYTARVGGGLASQHADGPPRCEGEGCQPGGPPAPGFSEPASSQEGPSQGGPAPARGCARIQRQTRLLVIRARRSVGQLKRLGAAMSSSPQASRRIRVGQVRRLRHLHRRSAIRVRRAKAKRTQLQRCRRAIRRQER